MTSTTPAPLEHLWDAWSELTGPGAPFETADVEIRGITMRAFTGAPASMREVWLGSAGHGDATYLVCGDERLSYAEVHALVRKTAAALTERGISKGDRVAISMRNHPEWIVAYWATISIGAVVVGCNAWWTGPEHEYGLSDSGASLLVVDGERLPRIVPHLETLRSDGKALPLLVVRHEGDLPEGAEHWEDALSAVEGDPALPDVEIDPEDDACVFYTSGTTGFPKGAVLTHRGCTNNVMNLAFFNLAVAVARSKMQSADEGSGGPSNPMSFMLPVPLFHVTGCNCVLHPLTLIGGKIVVIPKWDPTEALRLIEREAVTNLTGVPTMARELVNHPEFDSYDTSTLVSLGGGGAPVSPDLVDAIDSKVENAAPGVGYGLTETCGVITLNSAEFFTSKPATVGPPMPTCEVRCVDEDGNDVAPGETGELWVKGANVVRGYLNKPEATAEAITDGWFHTGDIVRIDEDGFISIVDRAKDMVLRGGENVYSSEVEAAIYTYDGVAEVAVFAVPDERLGEEVGAAIHPRAGAEIDPDAIRAHVIERIAKHKAPRHIWIIDDPLPRNANGKFLKRELRDRLAGD